MRFLRRFWPHALLIAMMVGGGAVWMQHEELLDWAAARNYQPAAAVQNLVNETTMTPYAKRLFYANRPALEGKAEFNAHCTDPSEQVAVLGCYTGNRNGIYLYDVTDERLNGIEQVTAAHEMLHQAYDRLDQGERTRINGLLQSYHDLTATPALKNKIASYNTTEPDHLQNEMHSIFATEALNLPPELEEYYQRYFTSRAQLVAFHQRYQSDFDTRRAQLADYDNRLAVLKTRIDAAKQDLDQREQTLRARRVQLDGYLDANQIETYNAAVPGFNALVVAYRDKLNETNRLVEEFNHLLGERNALAVQERQLEQAIDSQIDPAAGQ